MRGKAGRRAEKWPHCRAGRRGGWGFIDVGVSPSKAGRVESEGSRFACPPLASGHPSSVCAANAALKQYRQRTGRIRGLLRPTGLAARESVPHLDCRTKKVRSTQLREALEARWCRAEHRRGPGSLVSLACLFASQGRSHGRMARTSGGRQAERAVAWPGCQKSRPRAAVTDVTWWANSELPLPAPAQLGRSQRACIPIWRGRASGCGIA
jgi:hypothetical protein